MHATEQEYTGGPAWHIAGRIVDAAAYAAACRAEAVYWDGRAAEADRSATQRLLCGAAPANVAHLRRDAAHYGRLALAWRARADAALAADGGAR
jgi:hypothetical protein